VEAPIGTLAGMNDTFHKEPRSRQGQAIVAGAVKGGQASGAEMKSGHRPYKPDWQTALILARAAPRCRARCRRSKLPCRAPAMRGGPVCRLHGGKRGGPKGERNGAYRTGRYTAEAKAERQAARVLLRELRRLIEAGDKGFGA